MTRITVNGSERTLPGEMSLKEFLLQEHYQIARIAVERNETIVPKAQYEETILKEGDRVEVVSFVGGG